MKVSIALQISLLWSLILCLVPAAKADLAYWATNGHYYEAVSSPSGISWDQAKLSAEARSYRGVNGHLVTLTSAEEDSFVLSSLGGPLALDNHFLGGFQPSGSSEPSGGWQWVTGEPWSYTNWIGGEPNNSLGKENALHYHRGLGKWNDIAGTSDGPGYIVEYPVPTLRSDHDLPQSPQLVPSRSLPDANKLVLYTHGHSDAFSSAMWDDFDAALTVKTGGDWGVVGYDWTHANQTPWLSWRLGAFGSLKNGRTEGLILGASIVDKGYEHVHLIAHSAGANLINSAAEVVAAANFAGITNTKIHTTFLDPFVPANFVKSYGSHSHWSDNYSAVGLPLTFARLTKAHNVDVTYLMPVESAPHNWPVEFYIESISNPDPSWNGYGFGRSLEGGGWSTSLTDSRYQRGKDWEVLGGGQPREDSNSSVRIDSAQDVGSVPFAKSDSVQVNGTAIDMPTASPAWLSMLINAAEPVNFVTFDAEFLGEAGAEGLLAMYWDGEVVSIVDERYTLPGSNSYTMWLPETLQPGAYELAFRLDPHTAVQSRVMIDNIQTGLAVVPEPSTLILLATSVLGLLAYGWRRRN